MAAASYSAKYANSQLLSCHSIIISDSLHTCRKLERYSDSDPRLDLIQAIHKFCHNIIINHGSLTILWVPAHIDLEGHDTADQLAKEGMNSDQTHNIGHSLKELKPIIQENFTKNATQRFWSEARTGSHGRRILPNFVNNHNINNFTKFNSKSQLLYRLIFGTAEFHIPRNRACIECNSNLSIEHTVMVCRNFSDTRNILRGKLNRINMPLTLENVLNPNCHPSIRESRNILIEEINNKFSI